MKILITFPGDRLTGACRYAAATARELFARGHDVVVALHGDGPATQVFVGDGAYQPIVHRVDMPNLRRSVRATVEHAAGVVTGVARLSHLIDDVRPDVILAHCIYNVWSALAARRRGVPLVAVVHELPSAFPAPIYHGWDWLLSRIATRVIVSSDEMRTGLHASSAKTVVVPPAIDATVFKPGVDARTLRDELLDGAAGPLVVCLSHIMEGKGQRELVEALPRVFATLPDARAAFVGGTNGVANNDRYRRSLQERLAALGIASRVAFVGERSDPAVVLAAADVVAYPSRAESFGLVAVEATAVGTPVVMNDVGVGRRLAAERPSVTIVPPDDPVAFADAIVRAANAPRGSDPLDDKWTIARAVDEMEAVLRTAASPAAAHTNGHAGVLRRARRVAALAVERVTPPTPADVRSVNLAITYYCNSRCTMCSIWEIYKKDKTRAAAELHLDDIERIFSSRHFAALRSVALTGGEPFLRRDLVDIAGLFLTRFPSVSLVIPTDSVSPRLTIQSVERIVQRYQPGRARLAISVSLDGLRDTHDRQRGLPCFDKALEVIHALSVLDLALNVSYTITPLNFADILPTYRLVHELGATFNMQFAQGSSNYYGERSTTLRGWREAELERVRGQILEIADDRWDTMPLKSRLTDTTDYFLRRMVDYQREPRRIFTCYSGTHSCFIDPYGDVYPCLMLDKKLGSAKTDGFDAVWDGPVAAEVRRSIARNECHCWTPCEACPSLGRSMDPLPALPRLARHRAHRDRA
jgi:radical SAM protein with 4Fe4S-binding SPASM domain